MKNMKLISLLTAALAMTTVCGQAVMAADQTYTNTDGSGEVEVVAEGSSAYTVTLPAQVRLTVKDDTKPLDYSGDFTYTVSGSIAPTEAVLVTPVASSVEGFDTKKVSADLSELIKTNFDMELTSDSSIKSSAEVTMDEVRFRPATDSTALVEYETRQASLESPLMGTGNGSIKTTFAAAGNYEGNISVTFGLLDLS